MNDIVAAARGAVGSRFRLHGREPAGGLDCVGLAAWAYGVAIVPSGYDLRSGDVDRTMMLIARTGLRRAGVPAPGDLLLAKAGPGQLHLGVWTGGGVIHADAMLRRVVERPGPPPWDIIGYWRR